MKKWSVTAAVILIIILVISLLAYHTRQKTKPSMIKVRQGNIIEYVQAAGYITPENSISVKSPIGGDVEKVYRDTGEYVKEGEPLVAIKPTPNTETFVNYKESVIKAQADFNIAEKNLQRYQTMIKEGLITEHYGDYLDAQQTYNDAKSTLNLAQQQLSLITTGKAVIGKKDIGNTVLAPVSGYIVKRNVDIGDYVTDIGSSQSATVLFTIEDMNNLIFSGYVDEADSYKIHSNMPATVQVGAAPNIKITGILTAVSLQSQQASASSVVGESSELTSSPFTAGFRVKVTKLKIPKGVQLRDGYSATANIAVKSALNVPIIPERVLQFDGEKPFVWILDKKTANPKKQFLTLGLSDGMNVQVEKGLSVGESVLDRYSSNN